MSKPSVRWCLRVSPARPGKTGSGTRPGPVRVQSSSGFPSGPAPAVDESARMGVAAGFLSRSAASIRACAARSLRSACTRALIPTQKMSRTPTEGTRAIRNAVTGSGYAAPLPVVLRGPLLRLMGKALLLGRRTAGQKFENGVLDGTLRSGRVLGSAFTDLTQGGLDGAAVVEEVDHPRIHVRRLRDRRRVPQIGAHLLHGPRDGALAARRRRQRGGGDGERHGGEHRRVPGAEVLRAGVPEVLLDVLVDVGGRHVAPDAVLVLVGEQLLPWPLAPREGRDDRIDLGVGQPQGALDAGLGDVVEGDAAVPVDGDVFAPDRREAEGAVLLGVVLPADPEEPEVEQPERARQHPAPGEAGGVQLTGDGSAGRRQAPGHLEHAGVLLAVTVLAPLRV